MCNKMASWARLPRWRPLQLWWSPRSAAWSGPAPWSPYRAPTPLAGESGSPRWRSSPSPNTWATTKQVSLTLCPSQNTESKSTLCPSQNTESTFILFPSQNTWSTLILFPSQNTWSTFILFPSQYTWSTFILFPSQNTWSTSTLLPSQNSHRADAFVPLTLVSSWSPLRCFCVEHSPASWWWLARSQSGSAKVPVRTHTHIIYIRARPIYRRADIIGRY